MKLLCVVLLVSSLIAMGTALVQPWGQPTSVVPDPICQLDSDCSPGCFCYKTKRQQRGQCVCTMDINVLNECTNDRDCTERNTRAPLVMCSCIKDNAYQTKGQCECVHAVG